MHRASLMMKTGILLLRILKKSIKRRWGKRPKKSNKTLKINDKASFKAKAKGRYIVKNFAANLEKYEEQEEILGNRNSYSKINPDATFMRMKEII